MVERGPHLEARKAVGRAIRRLDVLEYVILGVIAALSLLGGALISVLAVQLLDVPFRITWAVASLLVFVIPAGIVWGRELRAERTPHKDAGNAYRTSDSNG